MQAPVEITFRGVRSKVLETRIREKAEKLHTFYPHIIHCHVVVNAEHRHSRRGRLYHVTVEVSVPGGSLVISHPNPGRDSHEGLYVAVRDAFDAARRRLEDFSGRQRWESRCRRLPNGRRKGPKTAGDLRMAR